MKPGELLTGPGAQRVRALEAAFGLIARTRMRGMPTLNTRLAVETVDFGLLPDTGTEVAAAVGILITPWFMNLVWLPIDRLDTPAAVGCSTTREIGPERFAFIGAHDEVIGSFEACSLFSPMFEFEDPAAARATAQAVLAALRAAPAAASSRAPIAQAPPARRLFLLGRGAEAR